VAALVAATSFLGGEEGVLRSVGIREGDYTMPIHLELTIEPG
jgi:hypothetical protein